MDEKEKIEQYALGKLSGEALRAFEAQLAADPGFAASVREQAEMLHALRLAPAVDALREQLKNLENLGLASEKPEPETLTNFENNPKRPARTVPMRWYLAAAAALILLLTAVLFLKKGHTSSPEEIFAAHFDPPKSLAPAARRGAENADSTAQTEFQKAKTEAENRYEKGDFAASLQLWQQLAARPEAADFQRDLSLAAGLTAMQAGDFRAAISFFEKTPEGRRSPETRWFLALAQLRGGEIGAARNGFAQIAASDSPFAGQAGAVLKSLAD